MSDTIDPLDEHIRIFKMALEVLERKRADYSGQTDPFANFRKSQYFGVSPWIGAGLRLSDKLSRFSEVARNGGRGKVNEALLDTVIDGCNYFVLMYQLFMEESEGVVYRSDNVKLDSKNTIQPRGASLKQVVAKKRKQKVAPPSKDG